MNRTYPVSLYIHIPFCTKKCGYCDFYSISGGSKYHASVLDRIIDQTNFFIKTNSVSEIYTLYIGGGTPSALPLKMLDEFLNTLTGILPLGPEGLQEFTVEVNPEDISKQLLEMLAWHNVTRLSMGIQSLDEKVLGVLGRNTTRAKTLSAAECVFANWNRNISFDLITSVPGQELKKTLDDLSILLDFFPRHISLYALTFEENTPITRKLEAGMIRKLSEDKAASIFDECARYLEDRGYFRYEISNFSRQGYESVHNKAYWEMKPYIGAGPSAVSTIPMKGKAVRIENMKSIKEFLLPEKSLHSGNYEVLPPSAFLLEHLLMGFRLTEGIEVKRIEDIFSMDFSEYFSKVLDKWSDRIVLKKGKLSLDKRGLEILNVFLTDVAGEIRTDFPADYIWP